MISFLDVARARKTEYLDYDIFDRYFKDLSYGENPREKIDIFLPTEGNGPFPVILQVTGGGWIHGDKSMKKVESVFQTMLEHGYAVASMNYSLSDDAKYPVPILQVKAAIRFLRQNAEQYQINPERIFLYGNSAGGFLVLMAGYTDEREPFFDEPRSYQKDVSSRVTAIADIYGVTSLGLNRIKTLAIGLEPKYYCDGIQSTAGNFLGYDPALRPDIIAEASPLRYVRPGYPPTYVQHGKNDHTVSIKQSYDLVEKLLAVDPSRVQFEWFDGLDHSDPYFKSKENTLKILRFFDKYL